MNQLQFTKLNLRVKFFSDCITSRESTNLTQYKNRITSFANVYMARSHSSTKTYPDKLIQQTFTEAYARPQSNSHFRRNIATSTRIAESPNPRCICQGTCRALITAPYGKISQCPVAVEPLCLGQAHVDNYPSFRSRRRPHKDRKQSRSGRGR